MYTCTAFIIKFWFYWIWCELTYRFLHKTARNSYLCGPL